MKKWVWAVYCLPPIAPKIANSAKNKATGSIPITVQAVFLAELHAFDAFASVDNVTLPNEFFVTIGDGHAIAVLTLENINIPINRATAAPIKARMNPRLSIIKFYTHAYLKEKNINLSLLNKILSSKSFTPTIS